MANRGHGVGTSAARRKAPRRHPMVLAALAAAVVLAAGIGAYAAVRAGADRASPTGDTVVAGPSDDDTDPGATGSTTPEPTTSTAPTTDTTSTIEPSTTTTVELGPIGLPLTPEDAGLPADASVTEVDPGPGDHGFCNVSIPETGLEEQLATNLNHADGHETLNQTASRFESEDTAHAFFRAIADSNECRSSQHTTVNGEQGYTAATEILDPARAFGDEVLAYQTTLSFDSGSTRTARGYVVRRGDRVVSLFLSTDEPARLDQVPDLMALMLRRLGYDG